MSARPSLGSRSSGAKRLADESDFYGAVQQLGAAIKVRGQIGDDREVLPPLAFALAGLLTGFGQRGLVAAGAPARQAQDWKLPGMDFPLVHPREISGLPGDPYLSQSRVVPDGSVM